LLTPKVSQASLLENLSTPFNLEGRYIKYRFPNQKAKYLFEFLNRDDLNQIPQNEDLKLREWLLTVNGIGMKTASWITRNWLCSDRVAILDIHIYRAGLIAGFFPKNLSIEKDYKILEEKYLEFSNALDVSAANLDSLIWLQFKMANDLALSILKIKN
jgi:thermostable 8-oxoguanine DNA glycosylase